MAFADQMSEWHDWDVAAHKLGVSLGILDPTIPFIDSKKIFWTDNRIGRSLHRTLLQLVEAGVLESRDDDEQFRWHHPGFVNLDDY
ncbi:hypothetical protein ABT160_03665 [Streptomyces sp. NPDC001941]|uniref:hypothetical protein n=1 Tax=Streptomyces sp. NPDC001941 TaxID=3154659 RepID=UPI00332B4B56